jgi:NAD(P)-dependent dehydrogenase (short-subunit alcohol dehydrogenase family)
MSFTEKNVPDLTGYTVIVTGGNAGIGLEITKQLALKNARVYIASRSQERVEKAIQELNQTAKKELDLHFLQMDLLDLRSVKAAAATFSAQEERLDILINNAGVMNVPFKLSKDGFETQWQANYLAGHAFTSGLIPKMLATAAASGDKTRVRVINVASDLAFVGPKAINMADPNLTNTKGLMELQQRYGHSKQAVIRDAKELNDRYAAQGVTAYSLHPGITRTSLQNHAPGLMGRVSRTLVGFLGTTPLACALNSLYASTSPDAYAHAGKYLASVGKLDPRADKWLKDTKVNAQLWDKSESIISQL